MRFGISNSKIGILYTQQSSTIRLYRSVYLIIFLLRLFKTQNQNKTDANETKEMVLFMMTSMRMDDANVEKKKNKNGSIC